MILCLLLLNFNVFQINASMFIVPKLNVFQINASMFIVPKLMYSK